MVGDTFTTTLYEPDEPMFPANEPAAALFNSQPPPPPSAQQSQINNQFFDAPPQTTDGYIGTDKPQYQNLPVAPTSGSGDIFNDITPEDPLKPEATQVQIYEPTNTEIALEFPPADGRQQVLTQEFDKPPEDPPPQTTEATYSSNYSDLTFTIEEVPTEKAPGESHKIMEKDTIMHLPVITSIHSLNNNKVSSGSTGNLNFK